MRDGRAGTLRAGGARWIAVCAGLWAALPAPSPGAALQESPPDCELVRVGGYTQRTRFDSASFVHHATGGIDYRCSDGTRLLADSAVVFESNEQVHLFGRVFLEDPTTELRADSAQYFGQVNRLNAWSRVIVTDLGSGAVIRGRRLTYDQASDVRALDRMFVHEGQPRATIYPVVRAQASTATDTTGTGEAQVSDSTAVTEPADAIPEPTGDSTAAQAVEGVGEETPADSAEADPKVEEPADTITGPVVEGGQSPDSAAAVPASDTTPVTDSIPPADTLLLADTVPAGTVPVSDTASVADTLPPADTVPATDTLPPWEIEADHFTLEGRIHFRAGGNVVVTRDSLLAFGDSLDYDQESGAMSIFEGARVENASYLLRGESVSLTPVAGLREVLLARDEATLTGDDVRVVAPAIRMFLENGVVDRLVATAEVPELPGEEQPFDPSGLSPGDLARALAARQDLPGLAADSAATDSIRPQPAVSADRFNLSGDSIDILSPGQLLELVTAVGSARAEGIPDDTLSHLDLPEVARRDWMEGDTVFAHFAGPDSAANPPGSGSGPRSRLETLTAAGTARSLYRMIDADSAATEGSTADTASAATPTPADEEDAQPEGAGAPEAGAEEAIADSAAAPSPPPPALHWVEGQRIIVYLEGREVVRMDVEGQTVGYHLEPRPPGEVSDSALVRADSTAIPPPPPPFQRPQGETLPHDRRDPDPPGGRNLRRQSRRERADRPRTRRDRRSRLRSGP